MLVLKNKSILILFLAIFLPFFCKAGLITTAPGGTFTSGYNATQYTTTGTLRGHVMLKNGLSVPSGYSTWDGDGFVNGSIIWAAGSSRLILASDLKLGSTAIIPYADYSSKIIGQGNKIELGADLSVFNTLMLRGSSLTIDGKGHTLSLMRGETPQINGTDGATLTLKNMTLYIGAGPTGSMTIFGYNTPLNLILDNVALVCKSNGFFYPVGILGNGSLTIRGNVSIESNGGVVILSGESRVTVSIEKNSTLRVKKNTAFSLVKFALNTACTSFSMADQTSVLHLDGCDFYTSTLYSDAPEALNLSKGTVIFENKVRIFNSFYNNFTGRPNSTGNKNMSKGLIFGDGTPENDVDVRFLSSAYVTVDGCMKYNHS
jgi:hypothetical protein